MTPIPPPSLDRLAIHTWTNRALSLEECVRAYRKAGVAGISVWREHVAPLGVDHAARLLADSGLRVPALVRAGFFVHPQASTRAASIDECRRAIADAARLGAEMLVVVPGAHPGVPLAEARAMVADALASLVDEAASHRVRLALEPLHPMYAADRSCVNTLGQAIELISKVNHAALGVAVDVYHVWWDPDLEAQIRELGRLGAGGAGGRTGGSLFAFHVCDWKTDMRDPLNDRGCMGDGCIPIRTIRSWVESAGFTGMIEVEIFNNAYWAEDQQAYIERIKHAYIEHV